MAYVRLKLLIMLYFIDKSGFLRIMNFALTGERLYTVKETGFA